MPPALPTTTTSTGSGFNWTSLLGLFPLLMQLLGGGGDNTQTSTQTTIEPPRGIQDPTLGLLMPYMSDMLLKGMGMYGGAGMPGGQSFNSPFGGDIMSILGANWQDLLKAYQGGGRGVVKKKTPENKIISA